MSAHHYKLESVTCFTAGIYEAQVRGYDENSEPITSFIDFELSIDDALRYLPEVGKPFNVSLIPAPVAA